MRRLYVKQKCMHKLQRASTGNWQNASYSEYLKTIIVTTQPTTFDLINMKYIMGSP